MVWQRAVSTYLYAASTKQLNDANKSLCLHHTVAHNRSPSLRHCLMMTTVSMPVPTAVTITTSAKMPLLGTCTQSTQAGAFDRNIKRPATRIGEHRRGNPRGCKFCQQRRCVRGRVRCFLDENGSTRVMTTPAIAAHGRKNDIIDKHEWHCRCLLLAHSLLREPRDSNPASKGVRGGRERDGPCPAEPRRAGSAAERE